MYPGVDDTSRTVGRGRKTGGEGGQQRRERLGYHQWGQTIMLLKRLAVLGRRLTVGKLAAAIGLDFTRHRRA